MLVGVSIPVCLLGIALLLFDSQQKQISIDSLAGLAAFVPFLIWDSFSCYSQRQRCICLWHFVGLHLVGFVYLWFKAIWMKYYVIAGEASGDLHGANLLKALTQNRCACWMSAHGVETKCKPKELP